MWNYRRLSGPIGVVLFFDIDSTLTQGSPGTIHHKIRLIIEKIRDKGIYIFLATGRSMPDLTDLIARYLVERYAVAENGGIILWFGHDNYIEFGERMEPDKVLEYLRVKYGTPEDMRQGKRLTEVIFLKNKVSKRRLCAAIRATRAEVDIHPSNNSYHVSKKNINKGTAMLELCTRLHLGSQKVIVVGTPTWTYQCLKKLIIVLLWATLLQPQKSCKTGVKRKV